MKSNQIRKKFLDYFQKLNHEIIHSGSLVPHNDPTLMFTNSGMVQFKNIFTGKEKSKYLRAVTAQKCVRAGGKHNDLENVGYTARHHTFFEMLGNFSFGDYFKDLAIELAWNLITKEFKINKDKIIITVFNEDDDAYNLWKKISGLSNDKIIKINTSDNFWSMGETGPCGPCSEIFYDHGDKFPGGLPGSSNDDGDRYIEIWNLVFMQFEQISKFKRINLPSPSIDTGMGLERITALLQNTNDNYSTDIFLPLIEKSIDLLGTDESSNSPSHKVIADHLRSSAFLISDGVFPSNEGRGYVLRRIMRRGMRHAHSLGNKDPVFHKIFLTLLNEMKDSYPELERAKDLISSTLFNEENKFKQTIDNGLKILDEEINNSSKKILNGDIAFKLYDTYGFPLDLTQDYLKSKNMIVDIKQFEKNMNFQKERARKSWKGTGDIKNEDMWFSITENLEPTDFIGYDNDVSESIITKIIFDKKEINKINENDDAIIILNQTPFYGESGGQIGDTGTIENDNFLFEVLNTSKIFGKYFLHYGKVIKGSCSINNQITAKIHIDKRRLIKNNHSSTHLLHSALRIILGNHVYQKGSLITDKKLRFDFSHHEPIDKEKLRKIESLVNEIINQNSSVNIELVDHKTAIKSGAIALFGEKYGEEVRVVSIGKINNSIFSKELCGGTHIKKTGDIEKFQIISESSIASGIRRIEAITNITINTFNNIKKIDEENKNTKYYEEFDKYLALLDKINSNLKNKLDNFELIEDKLKEIKKIYNYENQKILINNFKKKINILKIGDYNFIYLHVNDYPINYFKSFIDEQKKSNPKNSIIMLVSINDNKISIIVGVTNDILNKFDAKDLAKISSEIVGGKGGGGRPDLAQSGGNQIDKIPNIFDAIKEKISN